MATASLSDQFPIFFVLFFLSLMTQHRNIITSRLEVQPGLVDGASAFVLADNAAFATDW